MSYKAFAIPNFRRNIKKLSKKYPSIKSDFAVFLDDIVQNPFQGEPLGKGNCYKVRLAIKSKGKGKSGGARVITCQKWCRKRFGY
jgi:mRNA-degrading endonuclease RelE of RelBE toxin-antitoxin system